MASLFFYNTHLAPATAYGPVSQSHFLHSLGIEARLKTLVHAARNDDRRRVLVSGYKRLVDPLSMGRTYKAMAVVPHWEEGEADPGSVPVGFEGWAAEELAKLVGKEE